MILPFLCDEPHFLVFFSRDLSLLHTFPFSCQEFFISGITLSGTSDFFLAVFELFLPLFRSAPPPSLPLAP